MYPFIFAASPLPLDWAMSVVPAPDNPAPKTVMKKTTLNAIDGAPISAVPSLPRKNASVRLYTVSIALPSIIGKAILRSDLKTSAELTLFVRPPVAAGPIPVSSRMRRIVSTPTSRAYWRNAPTGAT
jgi:hypothetical protein